MGSRDSLDIHISARLCTSERQKASICPSPHRGETQSYLIIRTKSHFYWSLRLSTPPRRCRLSAIYADFLKELIWKMNCRGLSWPVPACPFITSRQKHQVLNWKLYWWRRWIGWSPLSPPPHPERTLEESKSATESLSGRNCSLSSSHTHTHAHISFCCLSGSIQTFSCYLQVWQPVKRHLIRMRARDWLTLEAVL